MIKYRDGLRLKTYAWNSLIVHLGYIQQGWPWLSSGSETLETRWRYGTTTCLTTSTSILAWYITHRSHLPNTWSLLEARFLDRLFGCSIFWISCWDPTHSTITWWTPYLENVGGFSLDVTQRQTKVHQVWIFRMLVEFQWEIMRWEESINQSDDQLAVRALFRVRGTLTAAKG